MICVPVGLLLFFFKFMALILEKVHFRESSAGQMKPYIMSLWAYNANVTIWYLQMRLSSQHRIFPRHSDLDVSYYQVQPGRQVLSKSVINLLRCSANRQTRPKTSLAKIKTCFGHFFSSQPSGYQRAQNNGERSFVLQTHDEALRGQSWTDKYATGQSERVSSDTLQLSGRNNDEFQKWENLRNGEVKVCNVAEKKKKEPAAR